MQFLRQSTRAYLDLLHRRPLTTKMATSSFVACLGDAGCQVLVEEDSFDFARTARFGVIGAMLAPVMHVWFGFLMKNVKGNNLQSTIKRVALDQLVFTPVFMPMILSSVMLIEGRGALIPETLRREYAGTLVKNWMLWTPAQMINFRYVPPHLQVLFGNCVAALWNGFLSFIAHNKLELPGVLLVPEIETEIQAPFK